VLGDPGSWWQGAGGLEAGDLVLESGWLARHPPDLVIQVGPAPTSSAWEGQLARSGAELVIANGPAWADPASLAQEVWMGDPAALLRALAHHLGSEPAVGNAATWLERLRDIDQVACGVRDDDLSRHPPVSELEAVMVAADAVPRGGMLALGNSLAIRHAAVGGIVSKRLVVATQRGASGIDGLIAGVAGSVRALAGVGVLVLGDLSALHDLGGLAAARHAVGAGRLVIVVLDNAGGRIFERLPVARTVPDLRPWTTPDAGVDLVAVARGLGLRAIDVDTAAALRRALRALLRGRDPVGVIRIRVEPHDAADRSARLRRAVDAALAGLD
jgi:2-succinyl-5-enolpyruvyl-6-hydroxy-3-cyclohexene-1-carboxylate synthase